MKTILSLAAALTLAAGCATGAGNPDLPASNNPTVTQQERAEMVARDIQGRGIYQLELLEALKEVPREPYVDPSARDQASQNVALPMARAQGRLMPSPYRTAEILQALEVDPTHKVLEVGAGAGYRAALLARLAGEVYALEEDTLLAQDLAFNLPEQAQSKVKVRQGAPATGWPDAAPFDRILVSLENLADLEPLIDQLADGGLLVAPDPSLNHLHICQRLSPSRVQRRRLPLRSDQPQQP